MPRIVIVDAPSNLGLRPPQPGSTPGCAKAPEALREAGLHQLIVTAGGTEAGVELPGRYVDDDRGRPAGRLRNQDAIVDHSRRPAARLEPVLAAEDRPLVLGGDCGILVGAGLALRRRGRYALLHLDGHTDLRHPENSSACASLAGEDLAAATGRHWPEIADIDAWRPTSPRRPSVHLGCRDDDEEELDEARASLGGVFTSTQIRSAVEEVAAAALRITAAAPDGAWIHLDVDILGPDHLAAVDSPDPGGLDPDQLIQLLTALARTPSGPRLPSTIRISTRTGPGAGWSGTS